MAVGESSIGSAHGDPGAGTASTVQPPDEILMEQAMRGDREAYARIFERHVDRVRRTAYLILHDASSADDVAQETFTKGLASVGTYRGESRPQAWFYSIALNICRHILRASKNGAEMTPSQKLERGQRPRRPRTRGAFTFASQKETNRILKVALGFLTDAQREVFVLHYQDELPYEDIAQVLGIRAGAARALAHRAKAVLREKLGTESTLLRMGAIRRGEPEAQE